MTTIKATIRRRYTPVSVSAPPAASGTFTNSPASLSPSTRSITSNTATAVASGGTGSYTYAWTRIAGSTAISAFNPTSAATQFGGTVNVDSSIAATFRVTVSDGISSATADVGVSLAYNSGL